MAHRISVSEVGTPSIVLVSKDGEADFRPLILPYTKYVGLRGSNSGHRTIFLVHSVEKSKTNHESTETVTLCVELGGNERLKCGFRSCWGHRCIAMFSCLRRDLDTIPQPKCHEVLR